MAQNIIHKTPLDSLGYNFIKDHHLPKGKDEYYLRNIQLKNGIHYRKLSAYEIEQLVRNGNTSDNWNNILVSDAFNPALVKNCTFYGLVRIGKLEPFCLTFSDLKAPVGLYNSTIISCDFGDNVVINNVDYLSHYIIGSEVMITNVNELVTTNHAKFGTGVLKTDEKEEVRIWMEICNENTGRRVMPFNGMLPGDAFLWSRFRDDQLLQDKFKEFTEKKCDNKRGYYGKVGDRTVIKNCKIIKDVWVGPDAYFKGANKLKNLTVNSGEGGRTQIGEGCEIVNGIIGYGCRIFYGVKAVRFIMADHSQLKYGARLINSYLGQNATISCCEVLNSLIFPAHEQHHNNSFLCAALVMGQSNIAAGATIGSNHNSRSADGEIIMGRGFWPGLCVSLKHNSVFASFSMVGKGDYPAELKIDIPFCLISNDVHNDQLTIMPAYWFLYNMYALSRNAWKYQDRDKRFDKTQVLEYDYLAPDSINEIFEALTKLELYTGKAYLRSQKKTPSDTKEAIEVGRLLLKSNNKLVNQLEILAEGMENSKRKTVLVKVLAAYHVFEDIVRFYGVKHLLELIHEQQPANLAELRKLIPAKLSRGNWVNIGGQLMPEADLTDIKNKILKQKIRSWDDLHEQYRIKGQAYPKQKQLHALAALSDISQLPLNKLDEHQLAYLLNTAVTTKEWITKGIHDSRAKDYSNPFRKMVYESFAEMNEVVGKLENNSFIKDQNNQLAAFKKEIQALKKKFKIKA
jgi:NDP-sugar pyrophosphorylase family protein